MVLASSVSGLFKWRQFEPEVILLAVGWYLRFSLSYRDVEELLAERGLPLPNGSPLASKVHMRTLLRNVRLAHRRPSGSVTALTSVRARPRFANTAILLNSQSAAASLSPKSAGGPPK
jgi:hypothetical protein